MCTYTLNVNPCKCFRSFTLVTADRGIIPADTDFLRGVICVQFLLTLYCMVTGLQCRPTTDWRKSGITLSRTTSQTTEAHSVHSPYLKVRHIKIPQICDVTVSIRTNQTGYRRTRAHIQTCGENRIPNTPARSVSGA